MSIYTLAALKLGDDVIDGIQSDEHSAGVNEVVVGADGQVYETFAAMISQVSQVSFSTVKVSTLLDLIGMSGSNIETGSPLELYFTERAQGGVNETTGVKVSCPYGMIYPQTLSASGSFATISAVVDLRGNDDGTSGVSAPFSITLDQTVPATATVDELFAAGPITIDSADAGEIVDMSVEFGITPANILPAQHYYNTFVGINTIKPRMSASIRNGDLMNTLGIGGKAASSSVVFRFNKIAEGGTRASTGHLTFTANQTRLHVATHGGSHEDDSTVSSLMVTPTYDGTNIPVVYAKTT